MTHTAPPYTPGTIANYFLKLAKDAGKPITPLQLQKLIYFAHGWWLAYNGAPLIDEPFEAWEYGPVCSPVYHEFKRFGNKPIPKSEEMIEVRFPQFSSPFESNVAPAMLKGEVPEDDKVMQDFLRLIWEKYGKFSGAELSNMTHAERGNNPWMQTYQEAQKEGIVRGRDIANKYIESYFKNLLKRKELY